jgi:hypothetical protein
VVLVLSGRRDEASVPPAVATLGRRKDLFAVYQVAAGVAPPSPATVDDTGRRLADPALRVDGQLGAVQDTLLVIRPDGHVGYRAALADADPGEYLARVFEPSVVQEISPAMAAADGTAASRGGRRDACLRRRSDSGAR